MHGKCSCNCSDARRGREDDHRGNVVCASGGEAAACRCVISQTAESLCQGSSPSLGEIVGYVDKVKKGRCKSWFCEDERCLKASGRMLKHRLIPVLGTFKSLLMLTFTVDPKLFPSPSEAFEFLRKRRCVAKTLAELHRQGLLHSRRYFCVVEWQMGKGDNPGTLMPHFHVLVEADYIPFKTLKAIWNKWRPKWAPPVVGNAPAFGHARISKRKFTGGPTHAAHYACKYLIKHPEKGYPEWVLHAKIQIKRYATSRGLLSSGKRAPHRDRRKQHNTDCSCDDCNTRRERRTTIAERTARCGQTTILIQTPLHVAHDGELIQGRPRFLARAKVPFRDVLWLMGVEEDAATAYEVTSSQWEDILQLDDSRRGISPAVMIPVDHPLSKPVRREAA